MLLTAWPFSVIVQKWKGFVGKLGFGVVGVGQKSKAEGYGEVKKSVSCFKTLT